MHLNPGNISDNFEDDASNHATQETPCTIFDSEEDLKQQQQAEDAQVKGVAGECRNILEMGLQKRASLQRAEIIRDGRILDETHREMFEEGLIEKREYWRVRQMIVFEA